MLSPLKNVVASLVPVADKSIVPTDTAPKAFVFTIPADINVPLAFVKVVTPAASAVHKVPVTVDDNT